MSQSLADAKLAAINTEIADSTIVGSILDLEYYLYSTILQTASGTISDIKSAYYSSLGFTGSLDDAEKDYMSDAGAVGSSLNDVRLDFYLNVGF